MKKFFTFIFMFIFIFLGSINTKAEIIESPANNQSSSYLCEDKYFNLIKGIDNKEELADSQGFFYITENLDGYLVSGSLDVFIDIRSGFGDYPLTARFYASNERITKYEAYLANELIYSFDIIDYEPAITYCVEVDLYKRYGISFLVDTTRMAVNIDNAVLNEDYHENDIIMQFDDINCFKSLYIMEYMINNGYSSDSEIHFIMDEYNPLPLEEIIDSIVIEDETDGEIKDYEIITNEYLIEDGYIAPGNYGLVLMTRDYAGNTTVLQSYVSVYDVTPPSISANDVSVSYLGKYTEDYLKKRFVVEDGCTLEIIENNYADNFNIPGKYTVIGQATDKAGNTNTAVLTVTVVDDRAPVITIEKNVCISTLANYTLADFKKYVSAYDRGENSYPECELVDTDGYLKNTRSAGEYSFYVTSEDSSGNVAEGYLYIKVIDSDYPIIRADEYTLIVSKGYLITREEVIEILKNRGQIIDDNIEISSSIFEADNPDGSYTLDIIDTDGNRYSNTIEFFESNQNIDYSPVIKNDKDEDYTVYYVIGGILLVIIVSIGVLLAVRYKKRH